jgi:hypothetical protein
MEIDKDLEKYGAAVLRSLQASGARVATKYVSPQKVIRATRRSYRRGNNAPRPLEIMLTVGKPNYEERDFVGWCTRAGEKFPIRNIIHKFPPKKRATNAKK